MEKIRPFLKWAGNKYRCLEHIISSLPQANRLIEPFAGSAALFINANYPTYLIAEENKDLISLFRFVQQEGEAFINYCSTFFSIENNSECRYYDLREQFNYCNNRRKRAALFLYLNRHGYNGLCRYNQKGIYNVPFGRYTRPYFPKMEMNYFHQKSQQANFIHSDFRQTFEQACTGDLIYCDPPYAPLSQNSNFTSYIHRKFGEKEQLLLVELAIKSATKGITVIISNHDTEFTRHHYRMGEIKSFPVTRSISCKTKSRGAVKELIAIFR